MLCVSRLQGRQPLIPSVSQTSDPLPHHFLVIVVGDARLIQYLRGYAPVLRESLHLLLSLSICMRLHQLPAPALYGL